MPAPDLIPIAREPGYRTDTIGRYADGQFYAAVHGARRDGDHEPDMGRERIRWYAYLHLFDADGSTNPMSSGATGLSCTQTVSGSPSRGTGSIAPDREQVVYQQSRRGRTRPAAREDVQLLPGSANGNVVCLVQVPLSSA
jgi:hypothetical protein